MRAISIALPAGALTVFVADSFVRRLRGLIGRPPLAEDEALLVRPCGSVHTLGMRYPIDVVYLDGAGLVLRVQAALPPRRFSACRRAAAVLELRASRAAALGLHVGLNLPQLRAR